MNNLKHNDIILIGASTGGPGLIEQLIYSITKTITTPIVIAQHMQASFLQSFAKRLNRINTHTDTVLVEKDTILKNDTIYILKDTSIIIQDKTLYTIQPKPNQSITYHPTIDVLFESILQTSLQGSGYILSGIGADGAKGLKLLKEHGFYTVAQDQNSSIVYGMPKVAKDIDAAKKIMSIDEIVLDILQKV